VHDLQVPHQHARSDVHVTGSELNFYLGGSDFHIWTRAILPLVEIASIFGVKIQQKAVAMLPSRDSASTRGENWEQNSSPGYISVYAIRL
jgi:hypothetical protein